MTVIKAKRMENPLQVLGLAKSLTLHTLQICGTESHFPKRHRWKITHRIVETALDIYICIRRANRVKVENWEAFDRRMSLQNNALEQIDVMLGLIDIAGALFRLSGTKVDNWAGGYVKLEEKARAWHASNLKDLKPTEDA